MTPYKYAGPFAADTKMLSNHREAELVRLLRTDRGLLVLSSIYKASQGIQPGIGGPAGTFGREMVASIIDHEYGKS